MEQSQKNITKISELSKTQIDFVYSIDTWSWMDLNLPKEAEAGWPGSAPLLVFLTLPQSHLSFATEISASHSKAASPFRYSNPSVHPHPRLLSNRAFVANRGTTAVANRGGWTTTPPLLRLIDRPWWREWCLPKPLSAGGVGIQIERNGRPELRPSPHSQRRQRHFSRPVVVVMSPTCRGSSRVNELNKFLLRDLSQSSRPPVGASGVGRSVPNSREGRPNWHPISA